MAEYESGASGGLYTYIAGDRPLLTVDIVVNGIFMYCFSPLWFEGYHCVEAIIMPRNDS